MQPDRPTTANSTTDKLRKGILKVGSIGRDDRGASNAEVWPALTQHQGQERASQRNGGQPEGSPGLGL